MRTRTTGGGSRGLRSTRAYLQRDRIVKKSGRLHWIKTGLLAPEAGFLDFFQLVTNGLAGELSRREIDGMVDEDSVDGCVSGWIE